jgi:hypothetical protein
VFPSCGFDLGDDRTAVVGVAGGTAYYNDSNGVAQYVGMFEKLNNSPSGTTPPGLSRGESRTNTGGSVTTAKINRYLHLEAGESTSRLTMVVTMGLEQFALTPVPGRGHVVA